MSASGALVGTHTLCFGCISDHLTICVLFVIWLSTYVVFFLICNFYLGHNYVTLIVRAMYSLRNPENLLALQAGKSLNLKV
jgi:hypothetical protein